MQSAVPTGTILQSHYRIVQLLGQGGFGRTYLAEDQGRFNERCAIKEFVPIRGEDRFSDKATQLFAREASVLYQISHPQIPKFRATFEEDERLFLVQDYVEGPTYHEVLNQRREQGRTFSETEVRQFLQQLLPVLAHIHARKIIHRDISPDNIILRQADQQPVLIDFGVVKEVVTRMQLDGVVSHATTVGKAGYAPPEQMQTGRAYPSSDLYSLAVTSVVLLTGKEPQALFDDVNATWSWQTEGVIVSPALASVLNKALSYRPGDRFGSVSEMAQALQAKNIISDTDSTVITDQLPVKQAPVSGSGAGLYPGQNNPGQNNPGQNSPGQNSAPDNSPSDNSAPDNSGLAGGMTGAAAGYAQNTPNNRATPPASQMKTVAVGRSNPNNFSASQGNQGHPNIGGTPTVNRPTTARQPGINPAVPPEPARSSSFLENPIAVGGLAMGLAAVASFGGWAVVQNMEPQGVPEPTITSLPPLGSEPTPTPTPTPAPTQSAPKPTEYNQPQLTLTPGVKRTVEGNMRKGDKVNYPLLAQAGQTLTVAQSEEGVLFTVLGPDGKAVGRNAKRVARWEGVIEENGEYTVQLSPVRGVPSSDYRLDVTLSAVPAPDPVEPEPIEPAPTEPTEPTDPTEPTEPPAEVPGEGNIGNPDVGVPPETPVQKEIRSQTLSFPPNAEGIRVANSVGPGTIRQYLVTAQEGQIITIQILGDSSGSTSFEVLMPGGGMMPDASGVVEWVSYLPMGGEYAINVQADQPSEFELNVQISAQIPTEPAAP